MPDIDEDIRQILFDGYVRELASLTRRMHEIAAPGTPERAIADLAEGLRIACANYIDARSVLKQPWHRRMLRGVRWRRS